MGKFIDLIGQRFGRLTVVEKVPNKKSTQAKWRCVCDCGGECEVISVDLRSGHTRSCGCLQREKIGNLNRTHGLRKTKIFQIYHSIKQRCYNSKSWAYKWYGAKGKVMDDYYLGSDGLEHFVEDVGEIPEGMTVDRIDNSIGYMRGNLKLSTMKDQGNNKSNNIWLEYGDIKMTKANWAISLKVSDWFIQSRLKKGMEFPEIYRQAREFVVGKHWHEDLQEA